jgi:hypothetical protein
MGGGGIDRGGMEPIGGGGMDGGGMFMPMPIGIRIGGL